jgi:hypothetical protein
MNVDTETDRESRIRAALGLKSGNLPKVEHRWLCTYHDYLAERLRMPFAAQYAGEIGAARMLLVTVEGLVHPDETAGDEENGLLCVARLDKQTLQLPLMDIEVDSADRNFQSLDDYWFWIWNWRFDPRI